MEYAEVEKVARITLKWQRMGLQQTATGYGSKLTTEYMVKIRGLRNIWRRVYAVCHSNTASFYVVLNGRKVFVRDSDLEDASL
jgi:hypothetical protein